MSRILSQLRKALDCLPAGSTREIVVLLGVIIAASILEAAGVGLIFGAIGILLSGDTALQDSWVAGTYAFSGLGADAFKLAVCGTLIVLFLGKSVFSVFAQYWELRFSNRNLALAAERLQARNLEMPYVEFAQRDSSDMISLQEHALPQAFINGVLQLVILIAEGLTVLAVVAALLFILPLMTLITLGLLSAAIAAYVLVVNRWGGHLAHAQVDAKRAALRLAREQLLNAKQIRVRDVVAPMVRRFGEVKMKQAQVETMSKIVAYAPRAVVETMVVAIVLGWVALSIAGGQPAQELVSSVAMFGVAALRLMPSSLRIVGALTNMRFAEPAVDRVWRELKRPKSPPALTTAGEELPVVFVSSIALADVGFTYPSNQAPALRGVTMVFNRGEAVAIVGASGAGKSTLLDIVLGLLTPSVGSVRVDGRDVAGTAAWRRQFGYVPQSVYLWNASVRENIAFGLPLDRIDESALQRAVDMANLREVVNELPLGLDTQVGEMGDRLSGGQRQRVGIARALYHDPGVLILDEATSALDAEAERIVSETVNSLRGLKTIILITHRPSLAMSCDRAYCLMRGAVVASGTPREVLTGGQLAGVA